jgi:hypothetical protein
MADARFTLVSAYDGPVHFNVKFCSGLRDRPASPSANLPARGHAVQSPASNAIVGAELGRALSPALAAATKSGSAVYGVTKRGTALGWLHRVIEMNRMKAPLG